MMRNKSQLRYPRCRQWAEPLERRRLLASLFDYVGVDPNSVVSASLGNRTSTSASKAALGSKATTALASTDSLRDVIWLANHVSSKTLAKLEKADGALQAMFAVSLRDGKSFTQQTLNGGDPRAYFLFSEQGPMVSIRTNNAADLATRLKTMGFTIAGQFDARGQSLVDVYSPVSRIGELAGVAGVGSMIAQTRPTTSAGLAMSEWPAIANVPQLNNVLVGSFGNNIDYGVMSDSMNRTAGGTGLVVDQALGDLPPGARTSILLEGNGVDTLGNITDTDEGRAMSQLIYDTAPSSDIIFRTAFRGVADFATGIGALATAGADVIVDDVGYLEEPVFQDGPIAQAAGNVATNLKVPYFSSAGNANGKSWYGAFSYGTNGNNYNAFNGTTDKDLNFTIAAGARISVNLQWAEPLGGATKDFDLGIWNPSTSSYAAQDTSNQIGGNPSTTVVYTNNTSSSQSLTVDVFYAVGAGSAAGMPMMINVFTKGSVTLSDPLWAGPSSYGHPNGANVFGVGAVPASNPSTIESFSSRGGVRIYFNANGTPIAGGAERAEPTFVAADGVTNNFFGSGNVFYGTSAAAPDAAAIAGLMQEAAGGPRSLTYAQTYDILTRTTYDLGPAGFDLTYGYGRVDGLSAVVAAHELDNREIAIELNQFGDANGSDGFASNSDIDSYEFATDVAGNVTFSTGSVLPANSTFVEGNVGSSTLLESARFGVPFNTWGISPSFRHTISIYPAIDISAFASNFRTNTVTINGPTAQMTNISVPDATGVGSASGTISGTFDADYFTFTTPAVFDTTEGVNIVVRAAGGLDAVVTLYDISGNKIVRVDAGSTNVPESINTSALATSTTYAIRVGSFNYRSEGTYSVHIRAAKSLAGGLPNLGGTFSPLAPIIPFGKTATSPNVQGVHIPITSGNSVAAYVFGADAQLGGNFTITATSAAFDTTLAVYVYNGVYGFNGELAAFNDDFSGTNSQVTFTATPGERYILAMKPFSSSIGNGSYSINVNYGGAQNETPITLNANGDGSATIQSLGSIPPNGEARTYSFVAPTNALGGPGTVTLSNQVGDGDIYVFDDTGNLIGGDSNGGSGNETVTIPSVIFGTTYHITVIPEMYNLTLSQGTVSVDLATVNVPAAPDLSSVSDTGSSNTDNITKNNSGNVFLVSGPVGTYMRLFRNGVLMEGPIAVNGLGFAALHDTAIGDGTYSYTATAAITPTSPQTPASGALSVTIDTVAPVNFNLEFSYDDNSDQRFFIDFTEPAIFTASPSVTNTTTGQVLSASNFTISPSGGLNDYIYNPTANNDYLPDGRYTLHVNAGVVQDVAGNALNAAIDFHSFFLAGDLNHDAVVNFDDLLRVAQNYGQPGKVFSQGNVDYSADGLVGFDDLLILAQRYGSSVAQAASDVSAAKRRSAIDDVLQ